MLLQRGSKKTAPAKERSVDAVYPELAAKQLPFGQEVESECGRKPYSFRTPLVSHAHSHFPTLA
ncbi:hypothetical protein NNL21_13335 [Paenibacillus mendelii]|uniref:Uncharacterized protein n=1 Tax=Paenibacillus mendelii TaxID=206163 RepID=A0ABV6J982_9BACL|nr:hypothetical protein [Paenibacillus mendelii]